MLDSLRELRLERPPMLWLFLLLAAFAVGGYGLWQDPQGMMGNLTAETFGAFASAALLDAILLLGRNSARRRRQRTLSAGLVVATVGLNIQPHQRWARELTVENLTGSPLREMTAMWQGRSTVRQLRLCNDAQTSKRAGSHLIAHFPVGHKAVIRVPGALERTGATVLVAAESPEGRLTQTLQLTRLATPKVAAPHV